MQSQKSNLQIFHNDDIIFSHDGHWLHPLFALEDFLKENTLPVDELRLEDKIIGRGAAVLICRMGIRKCHGRTCSKKGLSLFLEEGVECSYDTVIDSLDCQTEIILTDDMTLDTAYEELSHRAGRSL